MKITPSVLLTVGALVADPRMGAAQPGASVESFRAIARKIVTESKVFPLLRATTEPQSSPEPMVTLLATSDGTAAKRGWATC